MPTATTLATRGMIVPVQRDLGYGGLSEIEIEPNVWQLVAIPVKYGFYNIIEEKVESSQTVRAKIYNYVVQQLETEYSDTIQNLVEIINAYIGDNNFFYNYVPGLTGETSAHNFPLIYEDGSRQEITPFWIKSKVSYNMVIKWSL